MNILSSQPLKGKSHQYELDGTTMEKAQQSADNIMTEQGYVLKSRDWQASVYTKGNRVLRILFGAFVKYNKVAISLSGKPEKITMVISNDSSGFSGGLIGVSQVNKEYNRVIQAFEEKLGSVLY
jgi:hypothetical protein